MADFLATTVCEPAKVSDIDAVERIIDKYEFNVTVGFQDELLYVYGYEWFSAYKFDEDGFIDDDEVTDDFLTEIQPYIEDKLIIRMVGAEKCRYVDAAQVVVTKESITWNTLDGERWKM